MLNKNLFCNGSLSCRYLLEHSGTGSYPYAVTPVEDSYLPAVSSTRQLFVRQTHRLPQVSCQAEERVAVQHSCSSVHLTSRITEVATGKPVRGLRTEDELRYCLTEI